MSIDNVLQNLLKDSKLGDPSLGEGLAGLSQDLDKIGQSVSETKSAIDGLTTAFRDLNKNGKSSLSDVREDAQKLFKLFTGGRNIPDFVQDAAQVNVALGNMSRQLGISAQNLLQHRYALQAVGSEVKQYENLLLSIQTLSRSDAGLKTLKTAGAQLGVSFLKNDGSLQTDILEQLNKSSKFGKLDRGKQSQLLQSIGGTAGLLDLVDSPRFSHIINSPNFKNTAPNDQVMQRSIGLTEDITNLKAENSKILIGLFSDIAPLTDQLIKSFTALEAAHPKTIVKSLDLLAAAIVALGAASIASPLIKGGVHAAKGLSEVAGSVRRGASKSKVSSALKNTAKAAPRAAGPAGGAAAIEEGALVAGEGALTVGEGALMVGEIAAGGIAAVAAAPEIAIVAAGLAAGVGIAGLVHYFSSHKNKESPDKIASLLSKSGLSAAETSGLLARMHQSSDFDPQKAGSDGKTYGLLQWNQARQSDFKDMFGHDIRKSTVEEQARFAVWEKRQTEKNLMQSFAQARSNDALGTGKDPLNSPPGKVQCAENIHDSLKSSACCGGAQTNHMNVTIGDINVTSHAADPSQVAHEVTAKLPSHLEATFASRNTSLVQPNIGGIS